MFEYFLTLSIVLCLFRLPILAFVSLRDWTVVLNLLPLIIVFIFFIIRFRIVVLKKWLEGKKSSLLYKIVFFSIIYFLIFFISSRSLRSIRELSSTTIFLFFPLFLDFCCSIEELRKLLSKIIPVTIILSFALTFLEFFLIKLGYLTAKEVRWWLTGTSYAPTLRISTFMGQGAISGLVPLAFFSFLFYEVLHEFYSTSNISKKKISLLILSSITVFLSDSLTLVFSMILVTILILLNLSRRFEINFPNKKKIFNWGFLILIILGCCFYLSGLGERYIAYFFKGQIIPVTSLYFPKIKDCPMAPLIFGQLSLKSTTFNFGCNPGEFHGLFLAFKYGFLLQLGWFAFLFFPFKNMKKIKNSNWEDASYWGAVIFGLAFLHYSGAELWGNNYIFSILLVIHMKKFKNLNV